MSFATLVPSRGHSSPKQAFARLQEKIRQSWSPNTCVTMDDIITEYTSVDDPISVGRRGYLLPAAATGAAASVAAAAVEEEDAEHITHVVSISNSVLQEWKALASTLVYTHPFYKEGDNDYERHCTTLTVDTFLEQVFWTCQKRGLVVFHEKRSSFSTFGLIVRNPDGDSSEEVSISIWYAGKTHAKLYLEVKKTKNTNTVMDGFVAHTRCLIRRSTAGKHLVDRSIQELNSLEARLELLRNTVREVKQHLLVTSSCDPTPVQHSPSSKKRSTTDTLQASNTRRRLQASTDRIECNSIGTFTYESNSNAFVAWGEAPSVLLSTFLGDHSEPLLLPNGNGARINTNAHQPSSVPAPYRNCAREYALVHPCSNPSKAVLTTNACGQQSSVRSDRGGLCCRKGPSYNVLNEDETNAVKYQDAIKYKKLEVRVDLCCEVYLTSCDNDAKIKEDRVVRFLQFAYPVGRCVDICYKGSRKDFCAARNPRDTLPQRPKGGFQCICGVDHPKAKGVNERPTNTDRVEIERLKREQPALGAARRR